MVRATGVTSKKVKKVIFEKGKEGKRVICEKVKVILRKPPKTGNLKRYYRLDHVSAIYRAPFSRRIISIINRVLVR